MILYLHGFRSSPQSTKARQLAARLEARGATRETGERYACPALSVSPAAAARAIEDLVRDLGKDEPLSVVGSSLGGYYATWIAERVDCRVVLLNPAVYPDRDLAHHLGTQPVYHTNETVEVKPEYLAELQTLATGPVTRPERYLLVAATGDEVLDWREMVARYPDAVHCIVEGSDHGLSGFASLVDDVIDFCLDRPRG